MSYLPREQRIRLWQDGECDGQLSLWYVDVFDLWKYEWVNVARFKSQAKADSARDAILMLIESLTY